MTKSYKNKSRTITIISTIIITIITYIATIDPTTLTTYLPGYEKYAIPIIVIATAITNAYSEEKRVATAEEIVLTENTEDEKDAC